MNEYLEFSKEVQEAIKNELPIVALESTIISHGMPYPQNIEMAERCEDIVRENGAVPATIAIMDGKIKIGLSKEELNRLATAKNVAKVSRRDFAAVIAEGEIGATTVASTMICAELAGIKFFVTGGIGGVHRGFEETMDVSADLEELCKTNVNVICAGAKSILDIPRTLEYLETKGVPVIGYKTDQLPAFFTRESGLKLAIRKDSLNEIAQLINAKDALELSGGTVIANPISEDDQLDKDYIDSIINEAVESANEEGISGKEMTPFLLSKIVDKTNGKSLEANISLVFNNAEIGSKLAVELSKLF
ncbi:pseudouridine-5'-phosphate glycosidase [Enterococcus raffinosus]|uniref:Pseudouridine-5'-phosphate glycosidase n=1 Tax=Enterococcus raffinosus TaxID=71452 RepID=A0AAW8T6U5_9ENTE|nr:pseudouridine-5'-phosphate glycosidase [Enterococcus raffinosus]MDT2523718.1 pseudouridine-5'-phosphate glycosidase [Enterococcus raffinosus]MDT2529687.1 pseudouridine-5'-phosphate glycosidase [Enterococcus raffinosus]MDT2534301.1 pseudouridine-5'-phosphate glycosidase [Enterococcus raffinosus]MDT2544855.1 pseudouridine-5'-phosphate glycosidase [Enterococcus raffinosus]MDT2556801.1 pseudouridine-5'-phosphate glycosidase [Enterococcus raffinosus]